MPSPHALIFPSCTARLLRCTDFCHQLLFKRSSAKPTVYHLYQYIIFYQYIIYMNMLFILLYHLYQYIIYINLSFKYVYHIKIYHLDKYIT